jgi:hypothetical protein
MQDIKDILEEIEFYDKSGKYAIADKLMNKIYRFCHQADVKDIGPGGTSLVTKQNLNTFNYFIRNLPECQFLYGSDASMQATILPDLYSMIQSGTSAEEGVAKAKQILQNANPGYNLDSNDNNFDNCIRAIMGFKTTQSQNTQPQAPSTPNNTIPTNNVKAY